MPSQHTIFPMKRKAFYCHPPQIGMQRSAVRAGTERTQDGREGQGERSERW